MLPVHPSARGADDEVLLLDRQLCFALHAASRRVIRAYQPALAELDLTYPQYLVMMVLWEWENRPPPRPTVSAMGERLDLDSGTLTPLLRRLEGKRLIERERSEGDGRELVVRATRTGMALKRRARRIPTELIERSPIPAAELIALRDQLQSLRSALPWPGAAAPAR